MTITKLGNPICDPIHVRDLELFKLIQSERKRQNSSVSLIASENITPRYCSDVLSSCLSSKYSEGLPNARYYGGNEIIDQIETLCINRALKTFSLDRNEWCVNVQPLSGSVANAAIYMSFLNANDTICYLSLSHGGHLSHGFSTKTVKVTSASKYFNCVPYFLNKDTELLDIDTIRPIVLKSKPKLIITGYSNYSRIIDFAGFRKLADEVGAYLMVDMAHIAGLIAAKQYPSPFDYADFVSTTTQKTLRGPRAALVFAKKKHEIKLNKGVFPGIQGGPHVHSFAAVAAALKQCCTDEFIDYQKNILKNAKLIVDMLQSKGFKIVSGGTDTHLLTIDLRNMSLSGDTAEALLGSSGITCNRNTVPDDTNALKPSGIRLGTPCMTSRGFKEKEFERITQIIINILSNAKGVLNQNSTIKEVQHYIQNTAQLNKFREEVQFLARKFPVPLTSAFNITDDQSIIL